MSLLRGALTAIAALALACLASAPGGAAGGSPCSVITATAQGGVIYRVLFAKNGAVQHYLMVRSSHNPETDDAIRRRLVLRYGPEAIDAPPLRIVSFRPAPDGGGFQIPDTAIDSCGRISHFR